MIIGLNEALDLIEKESIEQVWSRHQALSDATRQAVSSLGLQLFAKSPSNAVTAVQSPDGVSSSEIIKRMKTMCGMTIANGQDDLKDKIFRISHLGYYDEFDIISVIAGLEKVLIDLGVEIELGSGVKAAMKTLWNK